MSHTCSNALAAYRGLYGRAQMSCIWYLSLFLISLPMRVVQYYSSLLQNFQLRNHLFNVPQYLWGLPDPLITLLTLLKCLTHSINWSVPAHCSRNGTKLRSRRSLPRLPKLSWVSGIPWCSQSISICSFWHFASTRGLLGYLLFIRASFIFLVSWKLLGIAMVGFSLCIHYRDWKIVGIQLVLIDLGILTPLPQSELSTLIVPAGTIRLRGRVPQGCCKVMFDLAPKMLAGGGSGCFEEEGHHNSFKKKTNKLLCTMSLSNHKTFEHNRRCWEILQ